MPKNIALNTVCSCGAVVRDCTFWRAVVVRLNTRLGVDIWADPYALDMGFIRASMVIDKNNQTAMRNALRYATLAAVEAEWVLGHRPFRMLTRRFDKAIEHTLLVQDVIREVTGASLLVNSSKVYRYGVGMYMSRPQETRFVLLRRDGRGVMYSRMKNGLDRNEGVQAWINYYSRSLKLLEKYVKPEHVLHLKYEEIASNPTAELARICLFLGLDFKPEMLDFRDKKYHVLNGNGMRMSGSSEIRLDEKWRSGLSKDDLAYFQKHAGHINRELGYEA